MANRKSRTLANTVITPMTLSTSFFFDNTGHVRSYQAGNTDLGRYGRYDNPNWREAEESLANLEAMEEALLFPSGMSAISSLVMAYVQQGESIIYTRIGYRNIYALFQEFLPRYGVVTHGIRQADQEQFKDEFLKLYNDKCKIVFIEAPSNPHFYMVDLNFIRRVIDPTKTLCVVDSTFASPVNFQPVGFGADIVVHSCTKYLCGHGDLMAGCVMGRSDLIEPIRRYRDVNGCIPSPFTAYLLQRSLPTLALRMKQYNVNGEIIARYLEGHPRVKKVFYIGLASHPHHNLAQQYLKGYGGVISFEIYGDETIASQFVDALNRPFMGTNFGTALPMVEQCSVFTYYKLTAQERKEIGVSDTLIRLSLGLEDAQDMIADLEQAFRQIDARQAEVGVS